MNDYRWSEKIGDQEVWIVAILLRWVTNTCSNYKHTCIIMDFKTVLTAFYQTRVARPTLVVVLLTFIYRQETHTSKVKKVHVKNRDSYYSCQFAVIGSGDISYTIVVTFHANLVVIRLAKIVIKDFGIGATLFFKKKDYYKNDLATPDGTNMHLRIFQCFSI